MVPDVIMKYARRVLQVVGASTGRRLGAKSWTLPADLGDGLRFVYVGALKRALLQTSLRARRLRAGRNSCDHPGLGTLTFRRAEIVAAPR
jgi:hypothetical protein